MPAPAASSNPQPLDSSACPPPLLQGYTNARFVDGELLVFAPHSPFVRGAQLGFTYDVQRNQRYLIVLHRVDLDALFPADDE